jgi:hypothetical protein
MYTNYNNSPNLIISIGSVVSSQQKTFLNKATVCLHVSLYVSNHFNHCIKLFAPCGPLIANNKFLSYLILYTVLSLVGLWQNHVLYWTLIDFMWRHTTPFGKWRVNKYVSVCNYYRSFFHGTLHRLISIYFYHIYYHRVVTIQFCWCYL